MKRCEFCGKELARGTRETKGNFKTRRFCNRSCGHSRKSIGRRQQHARAFKLLKPYCESCGVTKWLHAHHCDEVKENNTPENIQTLCVICHHEHHRKQRSLGISPSGRAEQKRGIVPTMRKITRLIKNWIAGLNKTYEQRQGDKVET